jgi:hypothetical protein
MEIPIFLVTHLHGIKLIYQFFSEKIAENKKIQ